MLKREAVGAVVTFAVLFGVAAIFNATTTGGVGTAGWVFALLAWVGMTVVSFIAARRRVHRQS